MSQGFIDRARWEQEMREESHPVVKEQAEENIREMYPEAFEAVLHVAALADELEADGKQFRSSARPYKHAEAMAKLDAAARIRAALEGVDQ